MTAESPQPSDPSQPSRTAVLLIDDHTLVREVVASVLDQHPDFEVCAQAGTAEAGLATFADRTPDVVLLDIDMPGMDAFEAAETIRQEHPDTKLVFLSAYTADRYIDRALEVAADGYVTKGQSTDELVQALVGVVAGQTYFSPSVRSRLIIDRSPREEASRTRASALTAREREVLALIATGSSKRIIADELGLSVKTIEKHASNIMVKLDVHDRVALARYCVREQIILP